ncbi:uncharacterized protein F5891DRAFT_1248444 [Suillus fuscotomentosus]|uniref:Uncharacterized protein n=1 Tax=Suillus fuscotomentosus TaxID=1912939 RepID=A0AAD4DXT4_9AGAM|nr:uncharacterized protein F5891DRAFT_1248444 [Suillus fuscotomentosus]KAG1896091.1 hypothetical protein F5891DRAFT_1248444 [Suillus fuscotomentosus]
MVVMGSPSLPTCNSNSRQFDGNTHMPSLLFLHRFSIPDSALTRYDSYPERMLLDVKPDHLIEKMNRNPSLLQYQPLSRCNDSSFMNARALLANTLSPGRWLMNTLTLLTSRTSLDCSLTSFSKVFDVLDALIRPTFPTSLLQVLMSHDSVKHAGTKHVYPMSTNVMPSNLHHSFISDCNKPTFGPLLISMSRLAEDISDSSYQKSTFAFLTHCVQDR